MADHLPCVFSPELDSDPAPVSIWTQSIREGIASAGNLTNQQRLTFTTFLDEFDARERRCTCQP